MSEIFIFQFSGGYEYTGETIDFMEKASLIKTNQD